MPNTALHSTLTGSELHYSKLQLIVGAPSSIPTYVGQTVYDQQNNILYIATGISSLADWKTQSSTENVVEIAAASYSAVSTDNGTTFVLTYNGARTFDLPVSPINGQYIVIQDSDLTGAFTNNITVSAGSNVFSDGTSSYVISSSLASICFIFDFASSTWIVNASFIGQQPQVKKLRNITGSNLFLDYGATNALEISNTQAVVKKDLLIQDKTDLTKQLLIDLENAVTAKTTVLNFVQTANRVVTVFDATDRIVGTQTTDILTNKSFNNTTTLLAGNKLNFNNPANTFHTSLKGGVNLANLDMTLPTTAPIAGQVPYSIDTLGTLGWLTVQSTSQQNVATATDINALPSSTTTVILTGSTSTNLNGIVAGVAGQTLSIKNSSTAYINIYNNSGAASAGNKILSPNFGSASGLLTYIIPPSFCLNFIYDGLNNYWTINSQLSAQNIQGNTSGNDAVQSFIGEQVKFYTQSLSALPVLVWTDLAAIILGQGVWDVSCVASFTDSGDFTKLAISSNSGTNVSDQVEGDNQISCQGVSGNQFAYSIPAWRFVVSTTTAILYLKYYKTYICSLYGRISATRVG